MRQLSNGQKTARFIISLVVAVISLSLFGAYANLALELIKKHPLYVLFTCIFVGVHLIGTIVIITLITDTTFAKKVRALFSNRSCDCDGCNCKGVELSKRQN